MALETHLIGVEHVPRIARMREDWEEIKRLIEFVDTKIGTPQSLMLEIPPEWKKVSQNLRQYVSKFFPLAEEYERRGIRVIGGDRNLYVVAPPIHDEIFDLDRRFEARNFRAHKDHKVSWGEAFADVATIFIIGAYMTHYMARKGLNSLVPSKIAKRNQGLLQAFDDEHPQVAILDQKRAEYLKSQRPWVNYIPFH